MEGIEPRFDAFFLLRRPRGRWQHPALEPVPVIAPTPGSAIPLLRSCKAFRGIKLTDFAPLAFSRNLA